MGKIVFDLKENAVSAETKSSLKELIDALPSIHQSLLIDLSKLLPQKDAIAISFLAFLSAMDEMKVSRDVVMKAFDEAVAFIKEVEEE